MSRSAVEEPIFLGREEGREGEGGSIRGYAYLCLWFQGNSDIIS